MTGRAYAVNPGSGELLHGMAHFVPETILRAARCFIMPEKKPSPMRTQPSDDMRNVPRPMETRMDVAGPQKPLRNDKVRCAKARARALKKQREALRT